MAGRSSICVQPSAARSSTGAIIARLCRGTPPCAATKCQRIITLRFHPKSILASMVSLGRFGPASGLEKEPFPMTTRLSVRFPSHPPSFPPEPHLSAARSAWPRSPRVSAHTVKGLQSELLATAFVSSPLGGNATRRFRSAGAWATQRWIQGCEWPASTWRTHRRSAVDRPEWPRVTGVGFELPGAPSGFALVEPLDGNWELHPGRTRVVARTRPGDARPRRARPRSRRTACPACRRARRPSAAPARASASADRSRIPCPTS